MYGRICVKFVFVLNYAPPLCVTVRGISISYQLITGASILKTLLSGVGDIKVGHLVLNLVAKRSRFGWAHCWKMRSAMSWWSDHSMGRIWLALENSWWSHSSCLEWIWYGWRCSECSPVRTKTLSLSRGTRILSLPLCWCMPQQWHCPKWQVHETLGGVKVREGSFDSPHLQVVYVELGFCLSPGLLARGVLEIGSSAFLDISVNRWCMNAGGSRGMPWLRFSWICHHWRMSLIAWDEGTGWFSGSLYRIWKDETR